MHLSRLRSGERLVLVGAVGLAVLLGLNWFQLSSPESYVGQHESGIRSLGWFAVLLLLAAIASGLALVVTTVTRSAPALPILLAVTTTALGAFATLAIVVRLILQPGLGVDVGNADVDIQFPAWLGLLAAASLTLGAWWTMADERTDTEESRRQTEQVLSVRGQPRPAPRV
jgi:hypothetical protein